MVLDDITPAQQKIIKAVCLHQLDSLNRLMNNEQECDDDIILILAKNEVSHEEFIESLEHDMEKFEEVFNKPDDLRHLTKRDIKMFKHILANLESDEHHGYARLYPNAIKNLWNRLRIVESIEANKSLSVNLN